MLGLTVHDVRLDWILKAIAPHLDHCWWYLGGTGMAFPGLRPPARLPPAPDQTKHKKSGPSQKLPVGEFDPVDLQRYLSESKAASTEYGNWVDTSHAYGVGKPGFFRRYAAGLDRNWQVYAASDAEAVESCSFGAIEDRIRGDWFGPLPAEMPADLFLVVRDIDAAYVDLFLRDEWAFNMVRGNLATQRVKFSAFRPKSPGNPR